MYHIASAMQIRSPNDTLVSCMITMGEFTNIEGGLLVALKRLVVSPYWQELK